MAPAKPTFAFEFSCSYQNYVWFKVSGAWAGQVKYRRNIDWMLNHERATTALSPEQFKVQVEDLTGGLSVESAPSAMTIELCEAWNAWRQQERDAFLAEARTNPERYGSMDRILKHLGPVEQAWPARFDFERGVWVDLRDEERVAA